MREPLAAAVPLTVAVCLSHPPRRRPRRTCLTTRANHPPLHEGVRNLHVAVHGPLAPWVPAALRGAVWNAPSRPCDFDPSVPLRIDPATFERMLEKVQREDEIAWRAAYGTGLDVYELLYEDMQQDPRAAVLAMYTAIGIRAPPQTAPVVDKTRKTTSDNLVDTIVNFKEIERLVELRYPCLSEQLRAGRGESFGPCRWAA